MAFKDQQNLSKVEILFYKSNSYFLELRTCLNILIWILQVIKLLLGESTFVTMHMSRVMRKPTFIICENKDADQLRVTAKLISAFVFAA